MTALSPRRYIRLLPSVILVCGGLLVLKASGIVHDAYAQDNPARGADAMTPPPPPKDLAGADTQVASAAEVDVLTSLTKRRAELDARQAQIQIQTNMLAATEARVDTKIAQLKTLQGQIAALLAQRDDAQQKQVTSLIKTYGPDGMKPVSAAAIFNTLPDEILIPVAQGLKPGDLGAILSKMNPEAAQKLTVKLASKLTLPDTAQALAPVPAPPPGPTGDAAPAPGPVAQATPPVAPAASTAPAAKPPAPKTGG